MKTKTLQSSLFLLLAAAIWGFAFVAQRVGAKYVGSFTFNGIRFALGSLSLIPLILYNRKKPQVEERQPVSLRNSIWAGIICGCVLFMGASLQQLGMVETDAGKAAFITGLYIVLVPIIGLFLKHNINKITWIGAIIAVMGLYLLCVTNGFSVSKSDGYLIVGAFFWAMHILVIDYFTRKEDALRLSLFQFITCSILSLTAAVIFETITLESLAQVIVPILYGGICSVGVAYTLQVVGQKNANPAHSAIILSMETVFATLGGFLILGERLGSRAIVGCVLMFSGMLLPQLQSFSRRKSERKKELGSAG